MYKQTYEKKQREDVQFMYALATQNELKYIQE